MTRGQELKEVYESANSDWWVNVGSLRVQSWVDRGQDESTRPDVMSLMDEGRDFAWEAVAHRAESWSS